MKRCETCRPIQIRIKDREARGSGIPYGESREEGLFSQA